MTLEKILKLFGKPWIWSYVGALLVWIAAIVFTRGYGAGGMVSFVPAAVGSVTAHDRAVRLAESTRLFTLAESLGGVESLLELPAAMTHLSVAGSPLEVDPALVRLSVGIEAVGDLIGDLRQALDRSLR